MDRSEADKHHGYWLGGTNSNSNRPNSVHWIWTDGTTWNYNHWNGEADKESKTHSCLHGGVVERKVEQEEDWCSTWGNMEECCKDMHFVCKKRLGKTRI